MRALSQWFTKNPVAANLLALLVILGGLFTLTGIRIEGFPKIPPSYISVDIAYPNAGTLKVDTGVAKKVEKALEEVPGIKKTVSISLEGTARILVQKETGYSMIRLLNDVKTRVDGIGSFPAKAERPVISIDEFKDFALLVQVYGDVDEKTLQKSARTVERELLADPKISKIESFGKKNREIRIEINVQRLKAYQLSVDQVAAIVSQNTSQLGFGLLKNENGRIMLRSDVTLEHYDQLMALPLITSRDGSCVKLKDVATVVDGYEDDDTKAFFQGKPSVGMVLYTSSKGHLLEISRAAHRVVKKTARQLPGNVELDIWADYSVYMKNRLQLLGTNAWQGLFIVFIILALFLNIKLAFWVAMGIPFSIAGALALMGESFLNYSLNDITTFGMIIVLGILVDDAVVVGESIFEERQTCKDPIQGTVKGVHKVALATVFGVLTTIAAFYPLMLIKNDFGKILASFAMVVCISLIFSLIESKLVLPAHLAAISIAPETSGRGITKIYRRVRDLASGGLVFFNQRIYLPVLKVCLAHRYSALVVFIFLALTAGWLLRMGHVRTVFFPDIPGDVIMVSGTMEKGMPAKMAFKNARIIEDAADSLNRELMEKFDTGKPPIRKIMTAVSTDDTIEIYAELQPQDVRVAETLELISRWRDRSRDLEGLQSIKFSGNVETGGGFVLKVSSRETSDLKMAVTSLKNGLENIEGVSGIRDDLKAGESEIRLVLKNAGRHMGLTPADLAAQVGAAFGGIEIDRFYKNDDEVKLKIIRDKKQQRYIHQLLETRIGLKDGSFVPLPMVAQLISKRASGYIYRENSCQMALIFASLDKSKVSAASIFKALEEKVIPDIESTLPGVSVEQGGELEEEEQVRSGLIKALIMIVILIYALLAIPLKSYWKPIVIMSVIPFGFAGAAAGHYIAGIPLSVLSFFGMLALSGIVVNDSLVMLTRFNDILDEGKSVKEALQTAGSNRFRAIFLTTATTVCGLMPLLSETSEQAQYLIPAAVSLAYGELFATLITLLLVPILMAIAFDIRNLFIFRCVNRTAASTTLGTECGKTARPGLSGGGVG
jgi:multidrug efflux pump subunit AcrB